MESWREHGLLGFTINLQGGSPQGYSKEQPWENCFRSEGRTPQGLHAAAFPHLETRG